jgi:flagellar biosynthetic protein FliR
MGFLLQIVNAAIVVGGEAISNAMGLGFASMVDPNLGNVPLISQFMVILSTFIFLTLGGHLVVIQLLFQSFDSIPIGSLPPFADWLSIMFGWFPFIFLGAINLALSMMVSLLLLNIALGVMTRSAPALNIIAVGFPAILLVGLLAFNVNITAMVYAIQRLWTQALATLQLLPGV